MTRIGRKKQRGIALLLAIIALLLLTAVAASMIFMSNIESSVNNNYRAEQQAYFAARAGIEEARFRMLRPVTGQVTPTNTSDLFASLPTNVPGQNGGAPTSGDVIYLINPGTQNNAVNGTVETVAPWDNTNAYFDDELCHENYQNYPANIGQGLRCSDTPFSKSAQTYWKTPQDISGTLLNSYDPNTKTAASMGYKWVRIAMKENWGNMATTVDGQATSMTNPTGGYSAADTSTICYTGQNQQSGQREVLFTKLSGYTNTCLPSSSLSQDNYRPVYVVTALGTTASGSRRMLQAEVADSPPMNTNASLDTQSLVNINGSSVTIDGNDNCQCSCPVAKGSAAPTCTEIANPKAACTQGTQAIYSTQSVSSGGAVIAPTTPAVTQNASTFPYNVNNLIQNYKAIADVSNPSGVSFGVPPWGSSQATPSGDPGSPGEVPCNHPSSPTAYDFTPPTTYTPGSGLWCPQVTYFSGNQTFQGLTGAGVLVIDGDLTLHGGGGAFYGLLIVKGTLTISGNGCGQSCGLIGGVITGTGTVSDNTDTIGGGVTIQYDHCALSYNQSVKEPSILSMRELSY